MILHFSPLRSVNVTLVRSNDYMQWNMNVIIRVSQTVYEGCLIRGLAVRLPGIGYSVAVPKIDRHE